MKVKSIAYSKLYRELEEILQERNILNKYIREIRQEMRAIEKKEKNNV